MYLRNLILITLAGLLLASCNLNLNADDDDNGNGTDPDTTSKFTNVSGSNLPSSLGGTTTSARAADLDGDGDLDLALALSLEANKVLFNNGDGSFTAQNFSSQGFDTRDLVVADFNDDNFPDLFFTNNSSQTSELYTNNGQGAFSDISNRIPVAGSFFAADVRDIDGDNSFDLDILVGNVGQNRLLMNNGNAFFTEQSAQRLPQLSDVTQDVVFGDITGDGLTDIVVANEGGNVILVNTGAGFFSNQSNRYVYSNQIEESRDVELVDVDGDGDLDIYVGNSNFRDGANAQDRLLINDGSGFFSNGTADRLPTLNTTTFDAEFADMDGDNDPDLLVGNYYGGIRIFLNNGSGFFTEETSNWFLGDFEPAVMDLEIADYNSDGLLDIYLSVREGNDQLLLRKAQQ